MEVNSASDEIGNFHLIFSVRDYSRVFTVGKGAGDGVLAECYERKWDGCLEDCVYVTGGGIEFLRH